MIKYIELTAPEASAFRQAKILSIECNEGDQIKEGQTLFRVKSGNNEVDLPSTRNGRIVEIIATAQENITLSTALLLLETEVAGSTASKPIVQDEAAARVSAVEPSAQGEEPSAQGEEPSAQGKKPSAQGKKPSSNTNEPSASASNKRSKKSKKKQVKSTAKRQNTPNKTKQKKTTSSKAKQPKKHEQQTLDLLGDPIDTVIPEQAKKHPNTDSANTTPSSEQSSTSQIMSSSAIQITVPDIGADSAKVIEILVQVGDTVAAEDPLITLESDKASMDVPSSHAGTIKSISVQMDQDVSEGTLILELDAEGVAESADSEQAAKPQATQEQATESPVSEVKPAASTAISIVDITIPDIGGDSAKVIEILVKVGQTVQLEDPLVTLESDKASMDVPSSAEGVIESIEVAIDQDVSEGTLVATLAASAPVEAATPSAGAPAQSNIASQQASATQTTTVTNQAAPAQQAAPASPAGKSHASPSIRRFARELGVDLSKVSGSGRKNRVTQEDVKAFVKGVMSTGGTAAAVTGGSGIPPIPAQDFSKFGDIEVQALNKIKRLTASNLHRSWVNVPHVTHNDESNISDLESFRKQLNSEYKNQGKETKLSPLAFIVKAVVNGLQTYPQFNSSLEPGGENLILKKYFHIGIAVDTPNGLVVPVIRDADKKSVADIGKEMNELAAKARDKKLTMNDMSGACFTISSLGGIGGTGFTPIVNAPEVAILGVSRSKMQPIWNGSEFIPGMMLPLSLSYDHRVIDGAEAARFTRHVAAVLEDVRRLTV